MKTRTMNPRAWRPAVCDEEPKRKNEQKEDERKFHTGTEFESGHRKRVRLLFGGKWREAVYDRVSCSFVAPVILNLVAPEDSTPFPNSYYPNPEARS